MVTFGRIINLVVTALTAEKSGAIFDIKKLEWMNRYYLKNKDVDEIAKLAKPFFLDKNMDISNKEKFLSIIEYVKQRVNTLKEMPGEAKRFYEKLDFSNEQLNILNKIDSQKLFKSILIKLKNESNCDGNKSPIVKVIDIGSVNGQS